MQELKQQERQRLSDRPWSRRSRTSEAAVSGMGVGNSILEAREVDRMGSILKLRWVCAAWKCEGRGSLPGLRWFELL